MSSSSDFFDSANDTDDAAGPGDELEARLLKASRSGDVASLIYTLEANVLGQLQRDTYRALFVPLQSYVHPLFEPLGQIQHSGKSVTALHRACDSGQQDEFVRIYLLLYIVSNLVEVCDKSAADDDDVNIVDFLHRILHVRDMTYREWILQLLVLHQMVPRITGTNDKFHPLTLHDYDRCLLFDGVSSSATKLLTVERVTLRQALQKTHQWCRRILDDGTIRITALGRGGWRIRHRRRKPGSLFLHAVRNALGRLSGWMDHYDEKSYAPLFSSPYGRSFLGVSNEVEEVEQHRDIISASAVPPKRRKQKQQAQQLPKLCIDDLDTADFDDDDDLSSARLQFEWDQEDASEFGKKETKEVYDVESIRACSSIQSAVSTWQNVATTNTEEGNKSEEDDQSYGSANNHQGDDSLTDFSFLSAGEHTSAPSGAGSVLSSWSVWDDDAFWDEIADSEEQKEEREHQNHAIVGGNGLEDDPEERGWLNVMQYTRDRIMEVLCGQSQSVLVVDVPLENTAASCVNGWHKLAIANASYRDVLLIPARNAHDASPPCLRTPTGWELAIAESPRNTKHSGGRRRHRFFAPSMNTIEEEEEDFFCFSVSEGIKSMGKRRRELMVRKGKKRGKMGKKGRR